MSLRCVAMSAALALLTSAPALGDALFFGVGGQIYQADPSSGAVTLVWDQGIDCTIFHIHQHSDSIYWTELCTHSFASSIYAYKPDSEELELLASDFPDTLFYGITIDESTGALYVGLQTPTGAIKRIDKDSTDTQTLVSPAGANMGGLALDTSDRTLFWATFSETDSIGTIRSYKLDTGAVGVVATGPWHIADITVDAVNRELYFIDCRGDRIARLAISGGEPEEIVSNVNQAASLALDTVHGNLYWTNYEAGTLERAFTDGSGRETVLTGWQLIRGLDIVIDPVPVANANWGTVKTRYR